jgi:hypothetical protein
VLEAGVCTLQCFGRVWRRPPSRVQQTLPPWPLRVAALRLAEGRKGLRPEVGGELLGFRGGTEGADGADELWRGRRRRRRHRPCCLSRVGSVRAWTQLPAPAPRRLPPPYRSRVFTDQRCVKLCPPPRHRRARGSVARRKPPFWAGLLRGFFFANEMQRGKEESAEGEGERTHRGGGGRADARGKNVPLFILTSFFLVVEK